MIDVFTNIVAITIIEIVLICGLFSIAVSYLSITIGTIFALPVHYLLLLIEKSATLSLKIPISHINTGGFSATLIIIIYITLFVFYKFLINRKSYCIAFIICVIIRSSACFENYSYNYTVFFCIFLQYMPNFYFVFHPYPIIHDFQAQKQLFHLFSS